MRLNDAIFGLALLLLGGAVLLAVQSFPAMPGQHYGPAVFPGLIACGLCIGGLLLIVRGWRQRAEQGWVTAEEWVRSPRHILALAVLLAGVVFYIVASGPLGFLPTAVIILLALLSALRVPFGRALLVAVVATLVVHFAFYKLLRVPLPWGLLTPWAW